MKSSPPKILVTRPAPDGKLLCDQLEEGGYPTAWLPTLAFVPLRLPASLSRDWDWLIFVSPEAVRQGIPQLTGLSVHSRIAAIGEGTARALAHAGYAIHACPTTSGASDALLDLPDFQTVAGLRIAIIKGQGGRQHLTRTLRARGADITEAVVYQRICPVREDIAVFQRMVQQKEIRATVITSGEGLLNLLKCLGKNCYADLHSLPLIVISTRLAKLARRLGFQHILLAASPRGDAIMTALKSPSSTGNPA